ncbi:MAG: hypothetical protein H7840_01600 [Alphaproteobacteria bacterium]
MNQLKVIFNVVLNSRLMGMGSEALYDAQESDFVDLLGGAFSGGRSPEQWEEDRTILTHAVTQALTTILENSPASEPAPRAAATARSRAAEEPAQSMAPALDHMMPDMDEPDSRSHDAGEENGTPVSAAKAAAQRARKQAETAPMSFEQVFEEAMCAHIRRPLAILQVTEAPGKTLDGIPFLLAPAFADVLDEALRKHILPSMRKSRLIRTMSENYNWQEAGAATIEEIIHSGENNNPILHTWDGRWMELKVNPDKPKAAEKKGGGFFGLGKKEAAAPAGKPTAEDEARVMWEMMKAAARRHHFSVPSFADLNIFQTMIRYEPAVFQKAWSEIKDLYAQEFTPSKMQEQGREGSFRDGLNKWSDRLPTHIGEFMVIKSYYNFKKLDLDFLQRFSRSHGKNPAERKRSVPHLIAFIEHLGGEA